ncbi:MAG: hypothetical protein ACM3ZE_01040 [Myxococcales bacterium]
MTSIYNATATGFRIYLYQSNISPTIANDREYRIAWKGSPQNKVSSVFSTGQTARTAWLQNPDDPNDRYQEVDSSTYGFNALPWHQTALVGTTSHWKLTGNQFRFRSDG